MDVLELHVAISILWCSRSLGRRMIEGAFEDSLLGDMAPSIFSVGFLLHDLLASFLLASSRLRRPDGLAASSSSGVDETTSTAARSTLAIVLRWVPHSLFICFSSGDAASESSTLLATFFSTERSCFISFALISTLALLSATLV